MSKMNRREAMLGLSAAALGTLVLPKFARPAAIEKIVKRGRLKQSVSYWCYQGKYRLPEFARVVADMGLTAIDLLTEEQWPVVKEQGLICSMGYPAEGAQIPKGLNDKANHDVIIRGLTKSLPLAAKMNVPNLIVTPLTSITDPGEAVAMAVIEPQFLNCQQGVNVRSQIANWQLQI